MKTVDGQAMLRTRYLSRVVGVLTTRSARLGYAIARRLSGRLPLPASRRAILRECLPGPAPVVIDVGSNVGQFAARAFEASPGAIVLSIDPIPTNVEACRRRFADRTGYDVVHAAIGAEHVPEVVFNVYPYSQASSLLRVSDLARDRFRSLDRPAVEVKVPMRTLDDVVAERPRFRAIDLLKIDVEGFEGEVLRGASEVLRRTRHLLVETQVQRMHANAALFDEVCVLAHSSGFRFRLIFEVIRDPYGELLVFDLLFDKAPAEARDGGAERAARAEPAAAPVTAPARS